VISRSLGFSSPSLTLFVDSFTLRPEDRAELCENIILDQALFPRLYLHWNAGVRGYFIRLLVWRLSRLGIVDAEQRPTEPRDPRILALFSLMNIRLEAIRQRHDELEPVDSLTDDDLFKPKRSTICSTRGVKEAPFTVDELVSQVEEDTEDEEEPQELVRAAPIVSAGKKGGLKDVATVARVVSWLKGGLGKNRHNKANRAGAVPNSRIDPFVLDNIPASPPRGFDDSHDKMEAASSNLLHDTSWTAASVPSSDTDHSSVMTTPERPERRATRPSSPAFFSFEFENGLALPSQVDNSPSSPSSSASNAATTSVGTVDTVFPQSPLRRNRDPHGVVSPRVSLRFSKRISILPPAALDMFKDSGEAVPPIPLQYRTSANIVYDKKLHPYAVRGLRDYEDALVRFLVLFLSSASSPNVVLPLQDEWTDWVARLQEEEDDGKKHNRGFVDT
jgi:hypothetical protein